MGKKRKKHQPRKVVEKIHKPKDGQGSKVLPSFKRSWTTLVAIISIAASVLGIASFIYYLMDKKMSSQAGIISSPRSAQIKYLSVGSTRFIIDSPDGVFLKDGDSPVLTMNLLDAKLFVTTTIRDGKGEIIAELKNNEWQVNKNNIFDRNYTDNALEVRDQSGKVTLQVVHFGDTIHLAGVFRCRSGWTNVFCHLPEGGAVIDVKPPGVQAQHSIQPVFEYPSERHFGSSPGLSSLEKLIIHGPGPAYRMGGALDICKGKQQQ